MRTHACEHVFLVTSQDLLLSCLLPNLDRTMEEFKRKSVAEVQEWLRGEKFSEKVIDAFKGNFPDIIVYYYKAKQMKFTVYCHHFFKFP